ESPLGRALSAEAWANLAHDTGQRKDVEEALADANAALRMVQIQDKDNPMVLKMSIYSRVVAAGIYREAKLPEKRAEVLEEAARYVRRLEPFIDDLPNIVWPIEYFYYETDDWDKALKVAQRSLERSGSPMVANHCAVELYRQGKFHEALECLNRPQKTDVW